MSLLSIIQLAVSHDSDAYAKLAGYAAGTLGTAWGAWTKAVRPAYRACRGFITRADKALRLVEHELNTNSGSSLRDVVNATRSEVRAIGQAQALSTAMQHTLAAASRSPMFQTDAQGRCVWVNDTWQRATGVSLDEALGMGFVNGIHPDDRDRVLSDWMHAVADVRAFRCDYRYRHVATLDESRVRTEAHPIKTPDGSVAGYVGTAVLLDLVGREPLAAYDRRRAPVGASYPATIPNP